MLDSQFEIRAPWPSEEPLIRRLLPGVAMGADRLAAVSRETREILAVAAWGYIDERACGLLIAVRSAWRRQGLGRALATAAIEASRLRGCASIDATVVRAEGLATAELLLPLGFHLESSVTHIAVDLDAQRAALAGLARVVLPAGYSIRDCPAGQLVQLCRLWYLPGRQASTLIHIAAARQQLARALFRGAEPCAFVFYSRTPEILTVDIWAADPAMRGTRANIALMASLILPALADGGREMRFSWTEGTLHTPRFANRYSARTLAIQDQYLLRLLP